MERTDFFMLKRIDLLKSKLKEDEIDALLVTDPANLIYLCGYTGSNGMLLVSNNQSKPIFYTDFRYQEQINKEVKGCKTKIWDRNLFADFPVTDLKGVKKLGFESSNLSFGNYSKIKKQLKTKAKIIPTNNVVENQRIVKDTTEIEKIRKAVAITDKNFMRVLKIIKPKITEKDLAVEIDYQFKKEGDIAFPTIVAFGECGALPHAQPTNTKLKLGDTIVFDMGAKYQSYCSDMTRTVVMGKASKKIKEIYDIVFTAQKLALENIAQGKPAVEIDGYARNYIKDKGYGENFGHSLGHGIGLMVHELPTLASKSKDILKVNEVFSVEPGIYLSAEFGVRIEDLVRVKENGCEILTRSPKELIEL